MWVRLPPSAQAKVTQPGRGIRLKLGTVWVRLPPLALRRDSPTAETNALEALWCRFESYSRHKGDYTMLRWTQELDERQKKEINFARTYADLFNHGTNGHNQYLLIAKLASLLYIITGEACWEIEKEEEHD